MAVYVVVVVVVSVVNAVEEGERKHQTLLD